MANEATLVYKQDFPINFIVANATGIEKGAVCMLTDPMTGASNTGTGDIFAGIAAGEKIASDGRTELGLYRRGIFRMTSAVGPTIAAGVWVATSGANLIRLATEAEMAAGQAIGIALEAFASNTTGLVAVGGF